MKIKPFIKKNWFGLISVLISFGMLWYFTAVSGGINKLYTETTGVDGRWIIAALLCVLLYWALDGYVLHIFTRLRYSRINIVDSLKAAMTGLFYSALTPFAIGGQPMQIVEMTQNGIDAGDAGSIITVKTILYQICMTLYAIAAVLIKYKLFTGSVPHFWLLVIVSLFLNLAFIAVVFFVSISRRFTRKSVGGIVGFLEKHGLLKQDSIIRRKVFDQIELFHESSLLLNRQRGTQMLTFVLTILQLTLFYLVPYCIYRSFHLPDAMLATIICAQAIISMITAFFPLPGGSGAAEGSFYLFFAMFFTKITVMPAVFIWRLMTYYFCILVGGIFSMAGIVNNHGE